MQIAKLDVTCVSIVQHITDPGNLLKEQTWCLMHLMDALLYYNNIEESMTNTWQPKQISGMHDNDEKSWSIHTVYSGVSKVFCKSVYLSKTGKF